MTCPLDVTEAPDPIYRLARAPDAWAWPDWASSSDEDGTFGNRWDDPRRAYRVVYGSTQRLATFMETLAPFRPDPAVLEGLDAIVADAEDEASAGDLPKSWCDGRVVSRARVGGTFAAVGQAASLAWIGQQLAARLVHYGVQALDGAAIRRTAPRQFTQEISRLIFECTDNESRQFAGITYLSKLGDEFANWAVFEPADITEHGVDPVRADDSDLLRAMELLQIRLADD